MKNGWQIAVAIVDPSGELVYFERMDDTAIAGVDGSLHKARSAARFKQPTKAFEDALQGAASFSSGFPASRRSREASRCSMAGKIVGAIGVGGVTSKQDGVCAQAGVAVLGSWEKP